MRNDNLPPNHHQIIHPHPRPLPPRTLIPARHPQLRAHLPAPVQEQPHEIALLHPACAARDIGPVVEDKGDDDVGGFDGFLYGEEFFAQEFAGLGFAQEG